MDPEKIVVDVPVGDGSECLFELRNEEVLVCFLDRLFHTVKGAIEWREDRGLLYHSKNLHIERFRA